MAVILLLVWLLCPEHIPSDWKEYWLWLVLLFILLEEGGSTVYVTKKRKED